MNTDLLVDYTHPSIATQSNLMIRIDDQILRNHLCSIWRIGIAWGQWRLVAHAIGSTHDLLYIAQSVDDDAQFQLFQLLKELEFLRKLADTRHVMERLALAQRSEQDTREAAA